jgi:hypothetical protein
LGIALAFGINSIPLRSVLEIRMAAFIPSDPVLAILILVTRRPDFIDARTDETLIWEDKRES